MFSKALFKQSCKANGTMWLIITFAVCFMLACVMLISGSDSIGSTISAVEDTIIEQEIDSSLEKRAVNYYENQMDGMKKFDSLFVENTADVLSFQPQLLAWTLKPSSSKPMPSKPAAKLFAESFYGWYEAKPEAADFGDAAEYAAAVAAWQAKSPVNSQGVGVAAFTAAAEQLQAYIFEKAAAIDPAYTADSVEAQEMLGSVMYAINPDGMFDEFYISHGESVPADYDVKILGDKITAGEIDGYLKSAERNAYIEERSRICSAIFLAGNITLPENVDKIIKELENFGVTKEIYDGFGFDYSNVKKIASDTVITYAGRLGNEMKKIDGLFSSGEIDEAEYLMRISAVKAEICDDIASSLLASLPEEVSSALEEIGKLDLYSLVVGSIFFKLAGLLLPIIYMIMASNNLIAGQVDSGSMAYVLSTSTKRETVAFTQAVYLISSLFVMFSLTAVTGCVCLAIVREKVELSYSALILLNVGAFLVLFALSGLCFFTSCWFDRSKRSMAVGGGLSIFSLVAAMLGLFGSPVLPKVVRLDALNYFNYVTVISLFDAVSIMDGTTAFIWKFAILIMLGVLGYAIGSLKFIKKDLPL